MLTCKYIQLQNIDAPAYDEQASYAMHAVDASELYIYGVLGRQLHEQARRALYKTGVVGSARDAFVSCFCAVIGCFRVT